MPALNLIAPEPTHHVTCLRPMVRIKRPQGRECHDAEPWRISNGVQEFEVVAFSDGGNKHAPETVDLLRQYFHPQGRDTAVPAKLIYVHCGQKCESMMPLLPSLLHAIDYAGPCCSMRIPSNACEPEVSRQIDRFVLGQFPDQGAVVLVVDRQDRIETVGQLKPQTVHISFLESSDDIASTPPVFDRPYV
ncbi:MAG: hypothetical protein ABJL99_26275 [Aliishimia sp.]